MKCRFLKCIIVVWGYSIDLLVISHGCDITGKVTPSTPTPSHICHWLALLINDMLIAWTCASKSNYTCHSIGMNAIQLFFYKSVCSRLSVVSNYHQPLGGVNREIAATANSMAGVGIGGLYVVPKIVCHGLWGSYQLLPCPQNINNFSFQVTK